MSNDSSIDLFGARVNLWMETGGKMVPFRNIAGNATNYIESVNIKISLMETFQVDVKMTPPLQDAITLIKTGKIGLGFSATKTNSKKKAKSEGENVSSSDKDYHLNRLAVQIEYGGLHSPIFHAILLMPELDLGEDGISITLKGFGMLFEQAKKSASSEAGKQMNGMTAIKNLLGHDGKVINVVFEPSAQTMLNTNVTVTSPGGSVEEAKTILRAHNCKFLYEGASKVDQPATIKVYHTDDIRQKPFCTFVAFQQINPNKKVYPILSLSTKLTNIMASQTLLGAKAVFFDKSVKESVKSNANYPKDVSGKVPSPDGSMAGGEEINDNPAGAIVGAIGSFKSNGALMMDKIKGVIYNYMESSFEYNITSVCIPNLLPARLVDVNVAGIPQLSNQYDLYSVEHSISNGGLETHIEVKGMGGVASAIGQGANRIASKFIPKNDVTGTKSIKKSKAKL